MFYLLLKMIQYHITLIFWQSWKRTSLELILIDYIITAEQWGEILNKRPACRQITADYMQFTHDLNWTAGLMEGLRGGAQVCGRLTGTWCFAGWRRRVWCRFLPRSERRVRRQRSAVSESRTARLRNTVTWQTFKKKLRLKRAIPDKLRLCQLKVNGFTHSVKGVPQGSTLGPM